MLTFEQTLAQLHKWLNEPVAVSVHPSAPWMPLQVAILFGQLTHAEEPPDHIRTHLAQTEADDDVFFFFVGQDDHRSHFVIARALFESAEMESTTLGAEMLAIWVRGIRLNVILQPNGA